MKIDGLEIQNELLERLLNNRTRRTPTLLGGPLSGPYGSSSTMILARKLALGGPFRAPHHTASEIALIGKQGNRFRCEVALAHNGIFFLDEVIEFRTAVMRQLNIALTNGEVRVVDGTLTGGECASNVWLIGAMHPCPCGAPAQECKCGSPALEDWNKRRKALIELFKFDEIGVEHGPDGVKFAGVVTTPHG